MATTSGLVKSSDRTVGVKVDMDEAVYILPIDDVPLQRWLPSAPTSNIKVEWMEESLTPQTDIISAVSGTSSPWTITVADGGVFRAGDVLHIQGRAADIQFLVSSISTNDLTVAGHGGTAASDDPVADDVVQIVGQVLTEGGDPPAARTVERTALYNYTQIGQEKVNATRTARKQAMYAQSDPYDHEAQKKFRELAIRFERALVLGQRYQSASKRAMGGLFYYITTNSRSGVKANVKSLIQDLVRDCWTAGGSPQALWVSPAVKAAITANYDAALRRSVRDDATAGFTVERLVTDFGDIDVFANRYFPTTKGLLLQREYDVKRVFDGYMHEALAKTGDADNGEIVGEFSLEVKNETAQGILTVTDAA